MDLVFEWDIFMQVEITMPVFTELPQNEVNMGYDVWKGWFTHHLGDRRDIDMGKGLAKAEK